MGKILVLMVSFLLFACATDEGESPRRIVNGKYSNTSNGVSLQFPANWTLKTDQEYNGIRIDLLAKGPVDQGFSPTVNVIIKAYAGSVDWAQIFVEVRQALQASFPDLGNYVEAAKDYDGITFGEIGYTASVEGTPFEFVQIIVMNKGTATTITFTDLAGRFDQNQDLAGIKASLTIE